MRRSTRFASLAFASGVVLAPLALFSPATAAGPIQSQTFATVGSASFDVPAGITCLQFQVDGASGGDAEEGGDGGLGGRTTGWYASTPGENIDITVGGRGADGSAGGAGGSAGISAIAGGDGGVYPAVYDNEPDFEVLGGGGGGGSSLTATQIIAVSGGGGGGGSGYNVADPGGDGGDADENGGGGGGAEGGAGGAAGGSVSGIGQRPDQLAEPANSGFVFVGAGGGGGGGNGGLAGTNSQIVMDTVSGGGGGGGGIYFFNPIAINPTATVAPAEGDGQVVLRWQSGDAGDCGGGFDPVDPTDPSDDGDGDGSNAGSTFDTGVTTPDSNNVLPLIGLAGGAMIATAGGIVLLTTRRKRLDV